MKAVFALISRNRKLFFKDRGMFFSALITPGILILLYATFLQTYTEIPLCPRSRT